MFGHGMNNEACVYIPAIFYGAGLLRRRWARWVDWGLSRPLRELQSPGRFASDPAFLLYLCLMQVLKRVAA